MSRTVLTGEANYEYVRGTADKARTGKTMMSSKNRRRGPAPKGPFQGKRATLTTRITDETRRKLEAASEDTGRSLSQEIEFRLEQSFAGERTIGELLAERFGAQGAVLLLLIGRELRARIARGRSDELTDIDADWMSDHGAYSHVAEGIGQVLKVLGPKEAPDYSGEWGWLAAIGDKARFPSLSYFGVDFRELLGPAVSGRVIKRYENLQGE
jgi:hypothetical protein